MGMQLSEARLQRHEMNYYSPKTLFVFGDSYVDTGNTRIDQAGSWKNPYGVTFPGKPAGRFSDGRVLTDFIGTCPSLSLSVWNTEKVHFSSLSQEKLYMRFKFRCFDQFLCIMNKGK